MGMSVGGAKTRFTMTESQVIYKDRSGAEELKVRKFSFTGELKYDRVERKTHPHSHVWVKVNQYGQVVEGGVGPAPNATLSDSNEEV